MLSIFRGGGKNKKTANSTTPRLTPAALPQHSSSIFQPYPDSDVVHVEGPGSFASQANYASPYPAAISAPPKEDPVYRHRPSLSKEDITPRPSISNISTGAPELDVVLSYGEPWGSIFREREFGQDTSKPAPSVIAAPAAPAGMTTSNRVLPAVLPTEPKPRLGVDRRAGNYYKKETVPLDLESDDEEPDPSHYIAANGLQDFVHVSVKYIGQQSATETPVQDSNHVFATKKVPPALKIPKTNPTRTKVEIETAPDSATQPSRSDAISSDGEASALAGSNLARAILGNTFVLSADNRMSRYRSGLSTLTRADSATLPRDNYYYSTSPWGERHGYNDLSPKPSILTPIPPIPFDATQVYVAPRTPRGNLFPRDQQPPSRSGLSHMRASSDSDIKLLSALPEEDIRDSVSESNAPGRTSPIAEATVAPAAPEASLQSSVSPSSEATPSTPDELTPIVNAEEQVVDGQKDGGEVSTSTSSTPVATSPALPSTPPSARDLAFLDYYSLDPSSPDPGTAHLGYRPQFSPIYEESLSQLSPASLARWRDSVRSTNMMNANARLRADSTPGSSVGAQTPELSGPFQRVLPPTAELQAPSVRVPSEQSPPNESPASSSRSLYNQSPGSSAVPLNINLQIPPGSKSFNRQRSGSAPSPIKIVRNPREGAYRILASPPGAAEEDSSTEERMEQPRGEQTFPETPSAASPAWSPGAYSTDTMPSVDFLALMQMAPGLGGGEETRERVRRTLSEKTALSRAASIVRVRGRGQRQASVRSRLTVNYPYPRAVSPKTVEYPDVPVAMDGDVQPDSAPARTRPKLRTFVPAFDRSSSGSVDFAIGPSPATAGVGVPADPFPRDIFRDSYMSAGTDFTSYYASTPPPPSHGSPPPLPTAPLFALTTVSESSSPTETPTASGSQSLPNEQAAPSSSPTPSHKSIQGALVHNFYSHERASLTSQSVSTYSTTSTSASSPRSATSSTTRTQATTPSSRASEEKHDTRPPPPASAPLPTQVSIESSISNRTARSSMSTLSYRTNNPSVDKLVPPSEAEGRPEIPPPSGKPPPYEAPIPSPGHQTSVYPSSRNSGHQDPRTAPGSPLSGSSQPQQAAATSTSSVNIVKDAAGARRILNRPPLPFGPRRPSQPIAVSASVLASGANAETYRERNGSVSSIASVTAAATATVRRSRSTITPVPKFATPFTKWRGHTLWTAEIKFSKDQMQEIVSRAVGKSAESTALRLLKLEAVDRDIPEEKERLEQRRVSVKGEYKMGARHRGQLLNSLTEHFSNGGEGEDASWTMAVLDDVKKTSMKLDSLAEELHSLDEQIGQLNSLCEVHWASALAVALHKVNVKLTQQLEDNRELREQIESLEHDRDLGWKQAQDVANDYDSLHEKLASSTAESTSRRSSRVMAARKSSIRAARAGLWTGYGSRSQRSSMSSIGHRLSNVSGPLSAWSVADDVPPVPPVPPIPTFHGSMVRSSRPADIFVTDARHNSHLSQALSTSTFTSSSDNREITHEIYEMLGAMTERKLQRSKSAITGRDDNFIQTSSTTMGTAGLAPNQTSFSAAGTATMKRRSSVIGLVRSPTSAARPS